MYIMLVEKFMYFYAAVFIKRFVVKVGNKIEDDDQNTIFKLKFIFQRTVGGNLGSLHIYVFNLLNIQNQ